MHNFPLIIPGSKAGKYRHADAMLTAGLQPLHHQLQEGGVDANKVKVGSTTNALEGIFPYTDLWIKNPIECSGTGSYRYITVCILKGAMLNGSETDLTIGNSTHMAEIEFYTK